MNQIYLFKSNDIVNLFFLQQLSQSLKYPAQINGTVGFPSFIQLFGL